MILKQDRAPNCFGSLQELFVIIHIGTGCLKKPPKFDNTFTCAECNVTLLCAFSHGFRILKVCCLHPRLNFEPRRFQNIFTRESRARGGGTHSPFSHSCQIFKFYLKWFGKSKFCVVYWKRLQFQHRLQEKHL